MSVLAVALVCATTLVLGVRGMRLARGTSDFYVAGRSVSPWRNASAIGGEYLSAASFLGVAGLIHSRGVDALWLPVGYTLGYLVLLVLVAAPLRRSGAYTLPDFAEVRLGSQRVRLLCAALVVGIGWLYLLPQLQGAGLALQHVSGLPTWVGSVLVALVVGAGVGGGGMRSITLVQAFQYWLKLTAIAVPAFVLLAAWLRDGTPSPVADDGWWEPLTSSPGEHTMYTTVSTLVALCLGTMGLPHVVVRFYTNPDGRGARRTTVAVLALLGLFYLFPPVYGLLGRVYLPPGEGVRPDDLVIGLPPEVLPGTGGEVLTAMLAGGAFAAFLSTASGLALSVAGALDQDVLRRVVQGRTGGDSRPVQTFRVAALVSVLVPLVVSRLTDPVGLSLAVGHAFAIAASTVAPLVILGVWWRRLTPAGAAAGVLVGGVGTIGAASTDILGDVGEGWAAALIGSPAAWTAPLAVLAMVVGSVLTRRHVPAGTPAVMARLHTPEAALTER